jgi:hypothetical protein
VTVPLRNPSPDALSKLIAHLQRHLASQGNGRERHRTKPASAPTAEASNEKFNAYLTQRIEQALAPLRPLLPINDVSFIGAMLRERLATDPSLSRLVERLLRAGASR